MSSNPSAETPAAAINAAIANLPTDVLQGEIQARLAAKLDVRDYNAALAARQVALPDPKIAEVHREHGISEAPKASDYNTVNYGGLRNLPTDRLGNLQEKATEFCAELGLPPSSGTALIERLAHVGPQVAKMSPSDRANWIAQQEAITLRALGGNADELAKMKADALEMLKKSSGEISTALASSPVLNDAAVLVGLATNYRSMQLLAKKLGR